MNLENTPLQPLRIPQGWTMNYNNGLYEIDPTDVNIEEKDSWWLFKEDMVQLTHERYNRLVDLGWTPEGDLGSGSYKLQVYEGDFRGTQLHYFETNKRKELVEEVERLLNDISNSKL